MNRTSDKPHTFEQTSMTFLMGFAKNECQILQIMLILTKI